MFRSFFLAGFEGSTGYNRHGLWFDQVVATGHDRTIERDYRELARLGIRSVRDCVRWPLVDIGRGRYDFATVDPMIAAASAHGMELIWDLFHYGYPDGLDPLGADFPRRFADYCFETGRYLADRVDGQLWFTPVNEPSFFAFAGGEEGLFAPHLKGRGWDLKIAMCRAAIAGIEALWVAAPGCRMVNVDPLCRVVTPPGREDLAGEAERFNANYVFQSWDMIAGRLLPELGGSPKHLDVVGINYYWTNQWEFGASPVADGIVPPLAEDDPRRAPLSNLLRSVWDRYRLPMIVSETSHVAEARGPWLRHVAAQAAELTGQGIELHGICLYPILGMPEWHEPEVWTPMGLWDPLCTSEPGGERLLCGDMAEALRDAARQLRVGESLVAA